MKAIPHTDITFLVPAILYNGYGTVCVISSLLANMWATVLVGIKAWYVALAMHLPAALPLVRF
jgi:type IV secretory pathway TrbD component